MSEFQRFNVYLSEDHENTTEVVLASDYDALASRLAEAERERDYHRAQELRLANEWDMQRKRLAEAERDAARLQWLADNPRGAQIVVDGKTQDCVFWGVSGHPRATLREAIDAAMRATDSATHRETDDVR